MTAALASAALETPTILDAWENLPAGVVGKEKGRDHNLSGVLARNEVARDYAYNRRLFQAQGARVLSVQCGAVGASAPQWRGCLDANLRSAQSPFIAEFTPSVIWLEQSPALTPILSRRSGYARGRVSNSGGEYAKARTRKSGARS